MSEVSKVSMTGRVTSVLDDLIAEFARLGYAPSTTARHLQLLAHLSRWMADHGIGLKQLSWDEIGRFCQDHELSRFRRYAPPAVMALMKLCRPECAPERVSRAGSSLPPVLNELLTDFGSYLRVDRALTDRTIDGYLHHSRMFLAWYAIRYQSDLGAVRADRGYPARGPRPTGVQGHRTDDHEGAWDPR